MDAAWDLADEGPAKKKQKKSPKAVPRRRRRRPKRRSTSAKTKKPAARKQAKEAVAAAKERSGWGGQDSSTADLSAAGEGKGYAVDPVEVAKLGDTLGDIAAKRPAAIPHELRDVVLDGVVPVLPAKPEPRASKNSKLSLATTLHVLLAVCLVPTPGEPAAADAVTGVQLVGHVRGILTDCADLPPLSSAAKDPDLALRRAMRPKKCQLSNPLRRLSRTRCSFGGLGRVCGRSGLSFLSFNNALPCLAACQHTLVWLQV